MKSKGKLLFGENIILVTCIEGSGLSVIQGLQPIRTSQLINLSEKAEK